MPYYTRKGKSKKDKGKICVYKKEDNTKVGCTAGPIEKYLAALHIHESSEMEWLEGPINLKYGDVMGDLHQFFKEGDIIYLTGQFYMDFEGTRPIEFNNTKAIVKSIVGTEDNRLRIHLGEEITQTPIWQSELSGSDVDLGDLVQDKEISITIPEKRINESEEEFEWIRSEGKERETIVKELNNFIDELNDSFNERGDTQLELDYEKTHEGGHYFGRIWVFNRSEGAHV